MIYEEEKRYIEDFITESGMRNESNHMKTLLEIMKIKHLQEFDFMNDGSRDFDVEKLVELHMKDEHALIDRMISLNIGYCMVDTLLDKKVKENKK